MIVKNNTLIKVDANDLVDGHLSIPSSVTPDDNSVRSILNSHIYKIDNEAFNDVRDILKSVDIPDGVVEIGNDSLYDLNGVFSDCKMLEKITIPESVRYIANNTFSNCEKLEYISLPDEIAEIPNEAFKNCTNLKSIKLPKGLKRIQSHAFSGCSNLINIEFPSGLVKIGMNAFSSCKKIKEINLPENLTSLFAGCFQECESLETVNFNKKISFIAPEVFRACTSLKSIEIPDKINAIRNACFRDCTSLESVKLPASLSEFDGKVFDNCPNLKTILAPKYVSSLGVQLPNYKLTKDGHLFASEQFVGSINLNELNISPYFYIMYHTINPKLLNEQKNEYIYNFYNEYLASQPRYKINEFMENHNFTFFKKLEQQLFSDLPENIPPKTKYKILHNLGVFSLPVEKNGKKIDYSQKISELLIQKFSKLQLNGAEFLYTLLNMQDDRFKPEFSEFFINNFDELLEIESVKSGFITNCYNNFEKVQQTNTNNHGSQRQLKATIEKFLDYFSAKEFVGITEENQNIADTISNYFISQKTFDLALEIMNSFTNKSDVSPHILGEPLNEKDIFKTIDDYKTKISNLQIASTHTLVDIAENEFKFEWLAKNDPQNLILGKLCSCCSHIEGVGYSIMHASIVHPNIQNLVIRDSLNRIIAKSTLFINKNEGYGVMNNVEINENYLMSNEMLNKIYEKVILGVQKFAEKYNEKNPMSPLNQINIGMDNNDLKPFIVDEKNQSNEILKTIRYEDYGYDEKKYAGDSNTLQYVIWKKKEKEIEMQ